MNVLKFSKHPHTDQEIIEHLSHLRQHALVESSHFAVSAIVEFQLADEQFVYVSGVNVEHAEHNRLTLHAEQNAIASAQSLFGGNMKFSKVWVMGAPLTIEAGSDHPLANNHVMPCGHCRQILLSFATLQSTIYSVTLNGYIKDQGSLVALLPEAFSERDLEVTTTEAATEQLITTATQMPGFFSEAPRAQPWKLIDQSITLDDQNIRLFCDAMTPHIIDPAFQTSAIRACMIKAGTNEHNARYFSGALIQDIAFLTTDAIFSSLGQAVTELGGQDLQIQEIHLYSTTLDPSQLSGIELQHLARFSNATTPLKFHTHDASSSAYALDACIDAFKDKLCATLHSNHASAPAFQMT